MHKMKYFVIILFLIFVQKATAQESANFIVEGKVQKTISFNLSDLKGYKTVALDSMTIYNHLLQRKGSIKNIKGVLSDPLKKQSGTIAMITPSDKATGRRFVKGLNKITILQVN